MSDYQNTVLITGGTTGLGYGTALSIAKQHPKYLVIIASRTDKDNATARVNKTTGLNNVRYTPLDLSSLANVRTYVEEYAKQKHPPIKALLLNAGLQIVSGVTYSRDGIETTFAITHVGNALLFYLLRPYLASDARITVTSSGTHDPEQKTGMPKAVYNTAEEIAHPTPELEKNPGQQRYTTSKLCNVLWIKALDRRLSQAPSGQPRWTINAFDPGFMPGTGLARDYPLILRFLWFTVMPHILPVLRVVLGSQNIYTTEQSGRNLARLATGDNVKGVSGVYFEGPKEIKSSELSYDTDKQENLYEWTIDTLAKSKEERDSFAKVYA